MRIAKTLMLAAVITSLAGTSPCALADAPGEAAAMRSMASVHFQKLPNVPDCCTIAVEHGNLDSGPFLILNKFTPGCSIPWHWHSQNEKVMMISGTGTFRIRGGEIRRDAIG